ncbi:MAG: hypothetical protein ABR518_02825 [Actinomycetota bacterium]
MLVGAGKGGRHLLEVGLVLGAVGGLLVAFGAYVVLRGPRMSNRGVGRAIERSATLIGFLLIAISLSMQAVVQAGRSLR